MLKAARSLLHRAFSSSWILEALSKGPENNNIHGIFVIRNYYRGIY